MPRGFLLFVLLFCVAVALMACTLAVTQSDREIRTEVLIAASPEEVWRVLAATTEYPLWNPFLLQVSGNLSHDEKLDITARPPGGPEFSFTARVVRATANRELAWRGGFPVPGILESEHRFLLESQSAGRTRLVHSEKFSGLLVGPATAGLLDRTVQGFREMNEALKARVEKGH